MPFGEELRKIRQEKGLSLRELSRRTDNRVSASYISRIESGQRPTPSFQIVETLAMALDNDDRIREAARSERVPLLLMDRLRRSQNRARIAAKERREALQISRELQRISSMAYDALPRHAETQRVFIFHGLMLLLAHNLVSPEQVEKLDPADRKGWDQISPPTPFQVGWDALNSTPPKLKKAASIAALLARELPQMLEALSVDPENPKVGEAGQQRDGLTLDEFFGTGGQE